MEGQITPGWFRHPQIGLIKIFSNENQEWVYQCYSDKGTRLLSKEKSIDSWTWALCVADTTIK